LQSQQLLSDLRHLSHKSTARTYILLNSWTNNRDLPPTPVPDLDRNRYYLCILFSFN
jgi:hypothetical protein